MIDSPRASTAMLAIEETPERRRYKPLVAGRETAWHCSSSALELEFAQWTMRISK